MQELHCYVGVIQDKLNLQSKTISVDEQNLITCIYKYSGWIIVIFNIQQRELSIQAFSWLALLKYFHLRAGTCYGQVYNLGLWLYQAILLQVLITWVSVK
jgi:hypothetical protein